MAIDLEEAVRKFTKTSAGHIWPSAGLGKKRRKALERAAILLASVEAVQATVKALAAGRLEPPILTNKKDARYAPYYAVGCGANEHGTVPYNVRWIEEQLVQGTRSKYLRVALALLQGRERGYVTQDTFDCIALCRPSYDLKSLERSLKLTEKRYDALHGAQIAMGA